MSISLSAVVTSAVDDVTMSDSTLRHSLVYKLSVAGNPVSGECMCYTLW